MTPYQEALLALAVESESAALALWWQVDQLGDALFAAALAAILATYTGRAAVTITRLTAPLPSDSAAAISTTRAKARRSGRI